MSVSNDTSGRKQAVAVRNIEFYRPESDALPWELLLAGAGALSEAELRAALDLDYTRIACQIEPAQTLGIYAMRRNSNTRFEMISVCVVPGYEHQLLGRRLLGHALGLAESKAGREVDLAVCASNQRALAITQRYGFVMLSPDSNTANATNAPNTADAADVATPVRLRFELTPE